jgi:hypothetical protein
MKLLIRYLVILVLLGADYFNSNAQVSVSKSFETFKTQVDSAAQRNSFEKPYLQFDKPYYSQNDTLWFKAYLLTELYLTYSEVSGILYVDITNDSSRTIKQYCFPVKRGLCWGNIALDEKQFKPGSYTLRAYTNWMCNWGEDYFFHKHFDITGITDANWLVNVNFNTSVSYNIYTTNATLQFNNLDKTPYALKMMQLDVLNINKSIDRQKIKTDDHGTLNMHFRLPSKTTGLSIAAENEQKDRRAIIPVILHQPDAIDVQFMPEGGALVAGLPAHIGFKAIGEDGKGVDISGMVVNKENRSVAEFQSIHKGIGSFYLNIEDDESYTAKVRLPNGVLKDFPLPSIKKFKTILQIRNDIRSDSLDVTAAEAIDSGSNKHNYFLLGSARNIVCYAAIISLSKNNNAVKRKIAKSLFPTGVVHFALLTIGGKPLNERIVYVDHNDNLNIQLTADKPIYKSHDSIDLKLKVTDNVGKPIKGSFSVAVTDDQQLNLDTIGENIVSRFLLCGDLRGNVEDPAYYLFRSNEVWQELDNLLITQGWIGYNWEQSVNLPKIQYEPEKEFTISGKVVNAFKKPVKRTKVTLFSKSPLIVKETLTDNNGEFVFGDFPRIDTPIFFLQAVNHNNKSFNVSIIMNEKTLPLGANSDSRLISPWYVNADPTLLNYTKTDAKSKELQYTNSGNTRMLKEVRIIATKIVKGSENPNGAGNADQVFDEKDLEKAGNKSFLKFFEENVKGFKLSYFAGSSIPWYFIDYRPIVLVVNGVKVSSLYPNFGFIDLKQYLEFNTADAIKGIEISKSAKYSMNYSRRFNGTDFDEITYVEITTRSGSPVISYTPGTFLYQPLALNYPKEFYKPKYTTRDTAEKRLPDLRAAIDWEPNIITDANGEATISFYSADDPRSYTIMIEGADMNGRVGYKRKKIQFEK